jgi:hypothetical protein
MHRWRAHMPVGMFLESEWDASDLPDPAGRYTLQQFYEEAGLCRETAPIPLETFTGYSMLFQRGALLK